MDDDKIKSKVRLDKDAADGVSWDDFEWKTYETVLDVNLSGGEATLGKVTSNEVVLNKGL